MREFRHLGFNLRSVDRARELLRRCFLQDEATVSESYPTTGYCSLRLRADDPRLERIVAELHKLDESPRPRAERVFTPRELDRFPWLKLTIRTAGLLGGANLDQPYDFSGSCRTCGAGARPVAPLIADLPRMGKKHLDATAHDGLLVATSRLATAMREAQLTGMSLQPVRRRSRQEPDPEFVWLQVLSEWPRMSPASVIKVHRACPVCGRSGHYHRYTRVTEYHYAGRPEAPPDIGHTWEYFGFWQGPLPERRPVGGARAILVSQRLRQLFLEVGVKRVSFEPIYFEDEES